MRAEVRVQAADAGLAVGLLCPRVASEPPADEEPRDAVDEDLRTGPRQRGEDVVAGAAWVLDAEGSRQRVVEDLARAKESDRDADRDGKEPFDRPQSRVPVLGDVPHRDRAGVHGPQERARDHLRDAGRQESRGVVGGDAIPAQLQGRLHAGEHRQQPDEKRDVHVPAAQGRRRAFFARDGAVARGDEEMERPHAGEDGERPAGLSGREVGEYRQVVAPDVVEQRHEELAEADAEGNHCG
jgi:hypothetical protein